MSVGILGNSPGNPTESGGRCRGGAVGRLRAVREKLLLGAAVGALALAGCGGSGGQTKAVTNCLKTALINKSNGVRCSNATVTKPVSKTDIAKLRVTCTHRKGTDYFCRANGAPAIIQNGSSYDVTYDGKTIVYEESAG
jgi:hypothetical protein